MNYFLTEEAFKFNLEWLNISRPNRWTNIFQSTREILTIIILSKKIFYSILKKK